MKLYEQYLKFNAIDNYYDRLTNFEKETKIKLPNDYKLFCKNKTYKEVIKELVGVYGGIDGIAEFNKFNFNGKEDFDSIHWNGLPKGSVIFAYCGGDVLIFYKNKIYFLEHDPLKLTKISNNFTEFLKKYKS